MHFVKPKDKIVEYKKGFRKFNYMLNLDHVETIKPFRDKDEEHEIEMYIITFRFISGKTDKWYYTDFETMNDSYEKLIGYIVDKNEKIK